MDGKRGEMTEGKRAETMNGMRRIMAWLMLVLFALLIVNISFSM